MLLVSACIWGFLRTQLNEPLMRARNLWWRGKFDVIFSTLDALRLERGVRSLSVHVGSTATFSCLASGIPPPQLKWLLNGSELSTGVSSSNETRMSTVEVTSVLTLLATENRTGQITCVAFHEREGQTFTVTSTSNLVVLSKYYTHVWVFSVYVCDLFAPSQSH